MGSITIVGLGPGGMEHLTLQARTRLFQAARLLLRTAVHPAAEDLRAAGVKYDTFDSVYERADSFEEIYETIAESLVAEAAAGKDITYAVPGHPMVGETSVKLTLRRAKDSGIPVTVIPGLSFVDSIGASLGLDPTSGCITHDALSFEREEFRSDRINVFMQVYSKMAASELKLALMEILPDDYPVTIIRAAGIRELETIEERPLYELDFAGFDHLTSVVVFPRKDGEARGAVPVRQTVPCRVPLDPLTDVMAKLRSEDGCPWDLKQTHESLKRYLIEETYEVVEAIEQGREDKLCEELGDLLLQVVFHAQIATESGKFDMNDVISGIVEKLVRRHPHVFGDTEVADEKAVLRNWEEIKSSESIGAERKSILDGVPPALPALMAAEEIQKKASRVGFDWQDPDGAFSKLKEELEELDRELAVDPPNTGRLTAEGGDLIFAAVNLLRLLGISAEFALRQANSKFVRRFQFMERRASEVGASLADMTLEEMDEMWEQAKRNDPPPLR